MKPCFYIFAAFALFASSGCSIQPDETSSGQPTVALNRSLEDVRISTSPLHLDNAVRLGILSSREVATAELGIRQKDNEITIARAGFYPELYANVRPVSESGKLASATAGIRYTLFDFGERVALLNGSVAAAEGSQYELIVEIEGSVNKTVESYISVSAEAAKVQAARNYVNSVRSFEKGVRGRVEIGVSSSVDVNELDTAMLRADTAVIEARSDHSNAKDQLASEIGILPNSVWSLSELRRALTVKSPPVGETDFAAFPRIVSLDSAVREAEYQLQATSAGLLPRIGLTLGVGVDLKSGGGVTNNGITAGPEISEVLSLGGGRQERISNAKIDVEVAKRRLEDGIRLARLEALQSRTSLNTSTLRVSQRQAVLDLTFKTRDVMFGEYDAGTRSLRDLLDAEETIYEARVALIEARRENLMALLRYAMAMNLASEQLYTVPQ